MLLGTRILFLPFSLAAIDFFVFAVWSTIRTVTILLGFEIYIPFVAVSILFEGLRWQQSERNKYEESPLGRKNCPKIYSPLKNVCNSMAKCLKMARKKDVN